MNLHEIQQILEMVREYDLAELELEQDGLKVRIKKNVAAPPSVAIDAVPSTAVRPEPRTQPSSAEGPQPAAVEESPDDDEAAELAIIKSPIVGTFYRSPEPAAAAFVEIGQPVRKRQVLCIIEAMKLMNEIDSEYDGEIVSAYVENGQAVQYGERLFAIRLRT